MQHQVIFHIAFPVGDIEKTKDFYVHGLGCKIGRQTTTSIILNLFGNQLVAHKTNQSFIKPKSIYPSHFGLIFVNENDWTDLLIKAQKSGLTFYQEPKIRFKDSLLEHNTFFLEDPFYNLLEFKLYKHQDAIFGAYEHSEIGDV